MGERFRALVLDEAEGGVAASIRELDEADLPDGEVTVAVEYSDLNYKDGMILKGIGRLVRSYPHVPGIDLAGTVTASSAPGIAVGDAVLVTGYRMGEIRWGGYAGRARVPADWVVKIPDGLDARRAMALGTAGFTAMIAVMALEEAGLVPGAGEVLVTGANGGVGSVAVIMLAALGHEVVASTGRMETADDLRALGAASVIDRAELAAEPERPLASERWAGAVDAVGGTTLASILTGLKHSAAVAACGLAGGSALKTTVIPFLLRGVRLLGIDSVMYPHGPRQEAWRRLAAELPMDRIDAVSETVGLDALPGLADRILKGQTRGRLVVDVTA
ncbi:MAG: oxidoreductase [Defluviicoccus sp.]|nr:oxidoreductase [Defluviicoccus sp.]MDE0383306.1 oxidoreductase [Defluviicoccus sp.]